MNCPKIYAIIGGCYLDGYDNISKFRELVIVRNDEELKQANDLAYQYAIESCESWEGQHGFIGIDEIAEDKDLDLEDDEQYNQAWTIFKEECENHADYCVIEATLDFCEGINSATVEWYQNLKKEIE